MSFPQTLSLPNQQVPMHLGQYQSSAFFHMAFTFFERMCHSAIELFCLHCSQPSRFLLSWILKIWCSSFWFSVAILWFPALIQPLQAILRHSESLETSRRGVHTFLKLIDALFPGWAQPVLVTCSYHQLTSHTLILGNRFLSNVTLRIFCYYFWQWQLVFQAICLLEMHQIMCKLPVRHYVTSNYFGN